MENSISWAGNHDKIIHLDTGTSMSHKFIEPNVPALCFQLNSKFYVTGKEIYHFIYLYIKLTAEN